MIDHIIYSNCFTRLDRSLGRLLGLSMLLWAAIVGWTFLIRFDGSWSDFDLVATAVVLFPCGLYALTFRAMLKYDASQSLALLERSSLFHSKKIAFTLPISLHFYQSPGPFENVDFLENIVVPKFILPAHTIVARNSETRSEFRVLARFLCKSDAHRFLERLGFNLNDRDQSGLTFYKSSRFDHLIGGLATIFTCSMLVVVVAVDIFIVKLAMGYLLDRSN